MEKRQCSQWSTGQNRLRGFQQVSGECQRGLPCVNASGQVGRPACHAWPGVAGPGGRAGGGRGRLRMLDRPRPASSTGKLGELPDGDRGLCSLGRNPSRLPPNNTR